MYKTVRLNAISVLYDYTNNKSITKFSAVQIKK